MGGKFHLRLNSGKRPIANKYREGKMKSTLKRELKAREIVKRETIEASRAVCVQRYPRSIVVMRVCYAPLAACASGLSCIHARLVSPDLGCRKRTRGRWSCASVHVFIDSGRYGGPDRKRQ